MNSKEKGEINQTKTDVRADVDLKNDNNQSADQNAMASKVMPLESKVIGEQLKLNSDKDNTSENSKLVIPSCKASIVFSNGTTSVQASTSDCANTLEQNANVSSVFMSVANIKPQSQTNTNTTCQLKHKTVVNASSFNLPKSQMHLNLSSALPNTHLSNNLSSVSSLNSAAATNTTLHISVSTPNTSLLPPNLSVIKSNDDIDMKNNVDYMSAIEKCPSKVSCSSDSSPETDYSWTSKSNGSNRVLNNISGSIGSTSQGTCCFLRPNINGSREGAGPSGLQRVRFFIYRILQIKVFVHIQNLKKNFFL